MSIVLDAVLFVVVFTLMLRVGTNEARIAKLEKQFIEFVKFQQEKESSK